MSSDISHTVRLLIERAPAADAADDVVERWGIYVVKLLDGLKARQPNLLSLPEVVSIIHLLQDIADVRLKIAWLAWGSDWLPGTMIEQCLFQLPVATASDPAPPPPHTQTTLPRATAVRTAAPSPMSTAALNLAPVKESNKSRMSGTAMKTVAPAAAFVAAPDHGPEKESDATRTAKRTAPNKALSSGGSERPHKRARLATPEFVFPIKDRSMAACLDMHSLDEPRKVLYKCGSCESRQKLCLTVTKKGVVKNNCAQCIFGHTRCEWKKGHLSKNLAYREESSSFYDPVGTAGPSDRAVTTTTSVSAPTMIPAHYQDGRINIHNPPKSRTAIRPPCGPSSAIKRRLSVYTRASPPTSPTPILVSPPAARVAPTSLALPSTRESYSDSHSNKAWVWGIPSMPERKRLWTSSWNGFRESEGKRWRSSNNHTSA